MKRSLIIAACVVAALALVSAYLYLNRPKPSPEEIEALEPGEPESYSATIIRMVDDGTRREEFVTRRVRSGELTREEWSEPKAGALIWRPDLGKCFLLDFERREYTEENLSPGGKPESQTENESARSDAPRALSPEAIYGALGNMPMPESEETRVLADQAIDNHPCNVVERRATFAGGHIETTRIFLARDLNGLAIRVETESTASKEKVITVRRDIKTEVSPDEFEIPEGFKKVRSLLR